jgi:acylphosphatase
MKRFTFIVSGNVQKAGYRDRVIELGKFVNLTGYAENLPDGRVRIIAEGEQDQLEFYREHINIQNTLIIVENIEYTESEATGEFYGFLKLVSNDETDARLDTAANILKDVIVNMNRGFDKLSNSMETGFNKVNTTLDAGFNHLANGQDRMLEKQDAMLEKQDESIKILNNINNDTSEIKSTLKTTEMDIRDARFSLTHLIETKFKEHDADIAQIKTTLAKVHEAIKAT